MQFYNKQDAFDAEDFCDFLQHGENLGDAELLDAFVARAIMYEDEALVLLNYRVNENEPARVTLERVRTDSSWWALWGSNP